MNNDDDDEDDEDDDDNKDDDNDDNNDNNDNNNNNNNNKNFRFSGPRQKLEEERMRGCAMWIWQCLEKTSETPAMVSSVGGEFPPPRGMTKFS